MNDDIEPQPVPMVFHCPDCGSYTLDTSGFGVGSWDVPGALEIRNVKIERNCAAPNCGGRARHVGTMVTAMTEGGFRISATDDSMLQFVMTHVVAEAEREGWTAAHLADTVEKIEPRRLGRLAEWLRQENRSGLIVSSVAGAITSATIIVAANFVLAAPAATPEDIDRMLRDHPPAITVVVPATEPPTSSHTNSTVEPSSEPQQNPPAVRESGHDQHGDR